MHSKQLQAVLPFVACELYVHIGPAGLKNATLSFVACGLHVYVACGSRLHQQINSKHDVHVICRHAHNVKFIHEWQSACFPNLYNASLLFYSQRWNLFLISSTHIMVIIVPKTAPTNSLEVRSEFRHGVDHHTITFIIFKEEGALVHALKPTQT